MRGLDQDSAARLARIALGHVGREYPNVLIQIMAGPEDIAPPRVLHPVFFGSLDWHSSVHTHWLLASVLRRFADIDEADAIRARFEEAFTEAAIAGELAFLARPTSRGFERPYGWAWLLMLAAELRRFETADGRRWAASLRPLADVIAARFMAWMPNADCPVRAGVHSNTAFALALTLEYADLVEDGDLAPSVPRRGPGTWPTPIVRPGSRPAMIFCPPP